ncbi:MAG: hypothetical protein ABSC22_05945 [Roseiarcus sp.]|jgi:multidrug resistance efflux pump
MPTVDEMGREALLALARRHSPAERAMAQAEALEAKAARAKADYDLVAEESARYARLAREAIGTAAGHDAFERCKALHGSARTAFTIYRRLKLAAERARRAARLTIRCGEAS